MRTSILAPAALACSLLSSSPARAQSCGPAPPSVPAGATVSDVYGNAKRLYEAKHYAEAAGLFRIVALEHSSDPLGVGAVRLALEAQNRAADTAGTGCYDAMAADVPRYQKLYCAPGSATAKSETCDFVGEIARDIARLRAEELVKKADRGAADAWTYYADAGEAYLGIWNDYYRDACENKRPLCERGEEILYNAARAFQAARKLDRAIMARETLFDPKNNLAGTALAKRSVYEQAASYQAITEYDRAADYYERFAAVSPKSDRAAAALSDAMILRLGLDDFPKAQRDLELTTKLYGGTDAAKVAAMGIGFAEASNARSRWADAEHAIETRAALFVEVPMHLRVRANAALGRALVGQGKADKAEAPYKRIDQINVAAVIHDDRLDSSDDSREIARFLRAVADAKLFLADREKARALKLKVKKGDQASANVKRKAVETAERAYAAIVSLAPAPPPEAVVAAAGSVARMRSQLAAQVFLALGPAAAVEDEKLAHAAAETCVRHAEKLQASDAGSRACAAWLGRHDRAHFAPVAEIIPGPRWLSADAPFAAPARDTLTR